MFKVICIDGEWEHVKTGKNFNNETPLLGETYTVVSAQDRRWDGINFTTYVLAEFPSFRMWESAAFIRVSSIDETEFVRDYNKETV